MERNTKIIIAYGVLFVIVIILVILLIINVVWKQTNTTELGSAKIDNLRVHTLQGQSPINVQDDLDLANTTSINNVKVLQTQQAHVKILEFHDTDKITQSNEIYLGTPDLAESIPAFPVSVTQISCHLCNTETSTMDSFVTIQSTQSKE